MANRVHHTGPVPQLDICFFASQNISIGLRILTPEIAKTGICRFLLFQVPLLQTPLEAVRFFCLEICVHLPGLEPRTTDPKSVVISISPQVQTKS